MRIRLVIALAFVAAGMLLLPAAASAAFHLTKVREVYPGDSGNATAEFAELQMHAVGQNFVGGHTVDFYNAAGVITSTATFGGAVTNGENQRSILIATTSAETQFGVSADLTISSGLSPAGGAVCFEGTDCVSWGSFAGALPSAAGSNAVAIPDGSSLERSIAPGDPTLLEAADDTNDSATDFAAATPCPRSNAIPTTETGCAAGGGNGGGDDGGGGDGGGGLDTSATKGKQSAAKLKIKVTADQDSTLDLGGKGKVAQRGPVSTSAKAKKFKLRKKTGVELQAGVEKTIRLKFKQNRETLKRIAKLQKRSKKARKRSKVIVNLTATSAAPGVASTSTLKIKLRP